MAQEPQHQAASMSYADYANIGMQGYEAGGHELYSLQTRMEMLGLPSKHHQHHHNSPEASWRGLFQRHDNSSSPGNGDVAFTQASNAGLMASSDAGGWDQPRQLLVDDSLRCLFPVHHDEQQPSQGLSLSLYKPEPDTEPAADFHRSFSQQLTSNLRDGGVGLMFSMAPTAASHHQQQNLAFHHDREFFPGAEAAAAAASVSHRLKLSKYLIPTQELLNEFCDLGGVRGSKQKPQSKRVDEGGPSNSPVNPSLQTLDILELQKRKAKLLTLLEEVDRRYRRYCEQMRAVVSSFEAVAGEGAATAYMALASKAMSRHFRSLRDGIVEQVQAAKNAMGEKDPIAPGSSRGETPRLKVLDQFFRQQKTFQQGGIMEHHPWRPQRGLPERSVSILRAWLFEHFLHPYPSDVDKHILARQTGLSRSQVSNWFINARVRLWKPMIEEMYSEEMKEHEDQLIADGQRDDLRYPKASCSREGGTGETKKPPPSELLSEPDSLSSIINAGGGGHHAEAHAHAIPKSLQQQTPVQRAAAENFGVVDLDFSSYSSHSYNGNGVSLTLGLQHHDGGGNGMEFSLSPANQQSLFYSRGQMEDCQPVQFSVLDGEVQNLPYRNLMGAQLLRDLAG